MNDWHLYEGFYKGSFDQAHLSSVRFMVESIARSYSFCEIRWPL